MREGWQEKNLGEVCELIKRGISPKYAKETGLCVINQKCIRNHEIDLSFSRLHDTNLKKINPERIIRLGDVLVNSTGTGTLGRVAQVRKIQNIECTVDSHVTIVRPLPKLFFNDFFGYALIKIEEEITKSGEGASGQTELARTKLQNDFKISFPNSLSEQKQIVEILDEAFTAIDQAKANIEKNIHNAKELFQSKLNGIFSQKGESWVEKKMENVCEIKSKLINPEKAEYQDLLHVGGGNIVAESGELIDLKTAREEGLKSGKFAFDNSVVLYNKIRPYLIKVTRPDFSGLCSADMYPLTPIEGEITRNFLYFLLISKDFTDYAIEGSGRAGMPKVNRKHLFEYRFSLPSVEIQNIIIKDLESLRMKCQSLNFEYHNKLASLELLKKSILQKAFAGELTNKLAEV